MKNIGARDMRAVGRSVAELPSHLDPIKGFSRMMHGAADGNMMPLLKLPQYEQYADTINKQIAAHKGNSTAYAMGHWMGNHPAHVAAGLTTAAASPLVIPYAKHYGGDGPAPDLLGPKSSSVRNSAMTEKQANEVQQLKKLISTVHSIAEKRGPNALHNAARDAGAQASAAKPQALPVKQAAEKAANIINVLKRLAQAVPGVIDRAGASELGGAAKQLGSALNPARAAKNFGTGFRMAGEASTAGALSQAATTAEDAASTTARHIKLLDHLRKLPQRSLAAGFGANVGKYPLDYAIGGTAAGAGALAAHTFGDKQSSIIANQGAITGPGLSSETPGKTVEALKNWFNGLSNPTREAIYGAGMTGVPLAGVGAITGGLGLSGEGGIRGATKGALRGGLTGAAVGGVGGYMRAKHRSIKDTPVKDVTVEQVGDEAKAQLKVLADKMKSLQG